MGTADRNQPFALGLAAEGQSPRIDLLRAGRSLHRRLVDLGLNVGSEISVVHRRGRGMILARDAGRAALGAGMAMQIMVVPTQGPGEAGQLEPGEPQ